jgi:hypothetical protein
MVAALLFLVFLSTLGLKVPQLYYRAALRVKWPGAPSPCAEAELKRRGLKIISGDVKTSFHVADPDGFEVQLGGLRQ